MSDPLERLKGMSLPSIPIDFAPELDLRARPVLRRRRLARQVPVVGILCLALIGVALWWTGSQPPDTGGGVRMAAAPDDLESRSTEELLAMRAELLAGQPKVSGSLAFIPLQNILESTDLVVQGEVVKEVIERAHLIEDIRSGKPGPFYVTVTLRVIESYPPLEQETIDVSGLGRLNEGEVFIALKDHGGAYTPMYGFRGHGLWRVRDEGSGPLVHLPLETRGAMTPDKAWEVIRATYDSVHGLGTLSEGDTAAQLDTLTNGSLANAVAALNVLDVSGKEALTEEILVSNLEARHDTMLAELERLYQEERALARTVNTKEEWREVLGPLERRMYDLRGQFRPFAKKTLELLYPLASPETVHRVLTLFVEDKSNRLGGGFDDLAHPGDITRPVLRLALKHPDADRVARVSSLLGKSVDHLGETGNRVGGAVLIRIDRHSLKVLAETPGDDIDRMLAAMLDPSDDVFQIRERMKQRSKQAKIPKDRVPHLMQDYFDGHTYALGTLRYRLQAGDAAALEFMRQVPAEELVNYRMEDVVWLKTPDPSFAPALREAAASGTYHDVLEALEGNGTSRHVLEALAACDEPEEAVELARGWLERPYVDNDLDACGRDVAARYEALLFLGRTDDASVIPLVRSFATEEAYAECHAAHEQAFRANRNMNYPFPAPDQFPLADGLQMGALLALTRLKDPEVKKQWRALYRSDDTGKRMTTAMALYCLGDDTGIEFVRAYEDLADRANKDIDAYLMSHGATGEFPGAIVYLRSRRLDDVALNRLERGLGLGDEKLYRDVGFVADYADRILPLLVKHLSSKDMLVRQEAYRSLELVLGKVVPWDRDALAESQPEAVRQWESEVAVFLSTWRPPDAERNAPRLRDGKP